MQKLHNEELHDVLSTTTNSRPVKSAEQAACVQTSETWNCNCCRRERTYHETRALMGDNIQMCYTGKGIADVEMIQLAHNRNQRSAPLNKVMEPQVPYNASKGLKATHERLCFEHSYNKAN